MSLLITKTDNNGLIVGFAEPTIKLDKVFLATIYIFFFEFLSHNIM